MRVQNTQQLQTKGCLFLLIVHFQGLLLCILQKDWQRGWEFREILTQFCRTEEGSSCCCGKDTKLLPILFSKKAKNLHRFEENTNLLHPRVQEDTHYDWRKKKISTLYPWGNKEKPSGTQTIKSLLYDVFNKKKKKHNEAHTKKARKTAHCQGKSNQQNKT